MITNQLKENIIQRRLRSPPFRSASFCFQYQFINLVWLSFDLFSFSWSLTMCFFVPLYSCVRSCPKISRKIKSQTNYGRTTALCMWTNEIKTKTPPSPVTFQCNGIIKGWLHCLISEPKGRFLVNRILMFDSAWCMVVAQLQFYLIKKWRLDVQNTR